jgi:O-antigen/teichoic acid export membrane protein
MFRRILHAANAIVFGHSIARLGSLILVPVFLRYWSASLYGEYVALFAAVGYLSSLDIGMQQAVINRLTQAYARRDLEEYKRIQHTALAFYMVLAVTVTVLVAMVVWFLPIPQWIGLRLTRAATAAIVVLLLAAYMMWQMPMRMLIATSQTMGNLARSQWIANFQQILVVVLSGLVLMWRGGMVAIASLQLLTVALTAVFVLLDVRHRSPQLFPGLVQARFAALKELAHPSMLFCLLLIANLIAFQGSVVLVSAVMGGLAVAVLSVSKTVIDVIRQALYSIGLALCPDFARMEALGEFEKLRKMHRMMVAGTGAITLALVASLWFEGAPLITLWTHGRIEVDVMLLRLFLVFVALQTPWAASSTIATATNRHQAQAVGYFCAAIVGITLVAVLLRPLGLWAVPVGLTLGEAVSCYHFVIKASCNIVGESYVAFARRYWFGFAAAAAATMIIGWIVHSTMPGPLLLRCIVAGLFTLTIAAACGWVLWLTPEDRALLLPKLRPVVEVSG